MINFGEGYLYIDVISSASSVVSNLMSFAITIWVVSFIASFVVRIYSILNPFK